MAIDGALGGAPPGEASLQMQSEFAALLHSFHPPLYWFRDSHSYETDRLKISGTLVLGPETDVSEVVATLNGEEVPFERVPMNPHSEYIFWYVPASKRIGIRIDQPIGAALESTTAAIRLRSTQSTHRTDFTFVMYRDLSRLAPTPPMANIERVSGKGATSYNYHNNGATDALRFRGLAGRHDVDVDDVGVRILDWGCGCGRLARHYLELPRGKDRVVGIDIDSDNIQWCQANLSDSAFQVTDLLPPTGLGAGSFGLIIANSVLSHLKLDVMKAWLEEVRRLLRPGGLALLSYHGRYSLCGFLSNHPSSVQAILLRGFSADSKSSQLDDFIADKTYYRQTFMTDDFARKLFTEYFDVQEIVTGLVSRFQNVAVLRAP